MATKVKSSCCSGKWYREHLRRNLSLQIQWQLFSIKMRSENEWSYFLCQILFSMSNKLELHKNSWKGTSSNSQYLPRGNLSNIFSWDIILVYCGGCIYSAWNKAEEMLFIITPSIKLVVYTLYHRVASSGLHSSDY